MRRIQRFFGKSSFNQRTIPFAFLFIAFIAFGLFAFRLGYYQDDWPYVFYAFNKGIPSLAEELYYDSRPNAAWLYMTAFQLLGFKPVVWQITALVLRWLTATTIWHLFRKIWPERGREVTFTVLLFIIHPFFLIQPYAVNSILYWTGFLLFSISLWLMVRTVTESQHRLPLTLLAVFFEAVHLFTAEYFVGMVLVRPLILYWLHRGESTLTARLRRVIRDWLPYLGSLALYVCWRLLFYVPPPIGDRNAPSVFYDLLSHPIQTLPVLIRVALQDPVIVTFTSWYKTLSPELFAFSTFFNWIVMIVLILSCVSIYFYLTRVTRDFVTPANTRSWVRQALWLGTLLVVLGLLPLWLIGDDIVTHKNPFAGTRFGIGATLGAAFIFAAIIEGLLDNPKKKIALVSVCLSLAIAMHLNNGKSFSDAWKKQVSLYQQLTWRAPEIESGTAIVTDMEILGYMGQYATSFGINTIYQPGNIARPRYWYFPVYYTYSDIDRFIAGIPIQDRKLSMEFSGQSTDSLVISFEPERDRCLWVLRPLDQNLRLVSEDMRRLSTVSAIERISDNNGVERQLPEAIFGRSERKGWCYYFEKADLARQYGRWDEVVQLYEQARAAGQQAENGFEYIPFIEGYGHLEDWNTVKTLTRIAAKISKGLEPSLCNSLDGIREGVAPSPERDETILKLKDHLHCVDYQ